MTIYSFTDYLAVLLSRPLDFVDCDEPIDLKGNKTAREELGFGCLKVSRFIITSKS